MKRGYEGIRVEPLIHNDSTAAATSPKKVPWTDDNHMVIVCGLGGSSNGTALSCTAANQATFTVFEATACTAAGSAITGATMSLGCATAYEPKSADALSITMTSNVTTAVSLKINGFTYYCTVSGVGSSGENVATQIAAAINGEGTFEKLPHYSAVGNWTATGIVYIYCDDGQGTGLSFDTVCATDFKPRGWFTGAIDISPGILSTARPKWIGVTLAACGGATAARWADAIKFPSGLPGFGGKTLGV